MAKKQIWAIRVINFFGRADGLPNVWIEQLRHMGHVNVLREYDDRSVLEFLPNPHMPRDLTIAWARQESERMQSFNLNAVAAPKWESGPLADPWAD